MNLKYLIILQVLIIISFVSVNSQQTTSASKKLDVRTRKYRTRSTTSQSAVNQNRSKKYRTRTSTKMTVQEKQQLGRTGNRKYRTRSTTQANKNQTQRFRTLTGQTRNRILVGTGRTLPGGATKLNMHTRPSPPNNRVRSTIKTSSNNNSIVAF
jgi:hypothetical protein